MSSWYRNYPKFVAAVVTLTASSMTMAAQTYFQPRAEIGAEVDTNRDLVTSGPKSTSEGYAVNAGGTWGIVTPRSDSTIRPQIGYTDYPDAHANFLRAIVDLYSQYRSERSLASIAGQFNREGTYTSELASAQFNTVNPNLPTTPETGRVTTDAIRTILTAAPSYSYSLTQRLNWNVTGTLQTVDYSGTNAPSYIPYDYYLGGTSLTWVTNPRMNTSFGVFASRESAKDSSGSVNSTGATLSFDFQWSKRFSGRLELTGERDESKVVKPFVVNDTRTGAGATFVTSWKGEISTLQFSAGRTFTPSGSGGIFRADQLQVEYSRDLSQRLAFTTAGRYIRYDSQSSAYNSSSYDYLTAVAGLKWKMTRTWYLVGNVEYLREKFEAPVRTASNGMLYAGVGYEGLGRPY